jgi:pimeloyl-ACP methyl ester carboxylesterase
VLLDECVQGITRAVERHGLRDVVLVGHDFAGPLVLQAAGQLPVPPKRLVLVAGIVPVNGKNMISVFPAGIRSCYFVLASWAWLLGKDLKLPPQVIGRYLYSRIHQMEVLRALGFFGPLPTRVLTTRAQWWGGSLPSPVSYVVLTQDRILPPALQRTMGSRIPNVEFIELESCHQAPIHRPKELAEILLSFA